LRGPDRRGGGNFIQIRRDQGIGGGVHDLECWVLVIWNVSILVLEVVSFSNDIIRSQASRQRSFDWYPLSAQQMLCKGVGILPFVRDSGGVLVRLKTSTGFDY